MLARYSCVVIGTVVLSSVLAQYFCLVAAFMLEGGAGNTQNVGTVFLCSHWHGILV